MNKYPLFSGKVISVPAIFEHDGEKCTLVDYLLPTDEEALRESTNDNAISALLIPGRKEELEGELSSRVKRAIVPIRLDPSIIQGANIRAMFSKFKDPESNKKYRTYEVEVLRGRSQAGSDAMAMLGEIVGNTPHTGFKYVRILEEVSE